jgi:hypothetical protein
MTSQFNLAKIVKVCDRLANVRRGGKNDMYREEHKAFKEAVYIPDLCNFIEARISKCLDWMGQDIYNVVNSEPFDTYHVVDKLNCMNEGEWKKLEPNWVCVDELDMVAPRSNCVLDNSKASKLYKLHTEDEILNMVCNSINGVQGV